jgi:hypothetical protein
MGLLACSVASVPRSAGAILDGLAQQVDGTSTGDALTRWRHVGPLFAPEAAEEQGRDPESDEQDTKHESAGAPVSTSDQRDSQDFVVNATPEGFKDYSRRVAF